MNYYELIKNELINNEVYSKVKDYSKNKHDLETRYNVGKLLYDAGKHYGEGIIKQYSIKLTIELGKGYDVTSLKRTRQFYMLIQKGAQFAHQLTWSHYRQLISMNNIDEINYYINQITIYHWSKRELQNHIKNNDYQRLNNKKKEVWGG